MSETELIRGGRGGPRGWAAVILLLAAAYPLSAGPAQYCAGRHWVPWSAYRAAYGPLGIRAVARLPKDRHPFGAYMNWWRDLAGEHGGY